MSSKKLFFLLSFIFLLLAITTIALRLQPETANEMLTEPKKEGALEKKACDCCKERMAKIQQSVQEARARRKRKEQSD